MLNVLDKAFPSQDAPDSHAGAFHNLVYDAACSICERMKTVLLQWDRFHRIVPVSLGNPEAQELLAPLPHEQRTSTFHVVSPRGRIVSGDAAIPELLRLVPGGTLVAWCLTTLPGHRLLLQWCYRWVANRHEEHGGAS